MIRFPYTPYSVYLRATIGLDLWELIVEVSLCVLALPWDFGLYCLTDIQDDVILRNLDFQFCYFPSMY